MECLEGESLRQRLARDVGPNGVRPRPNAFGPYSDVRARHGVPLQNPHRLPVGTRHGVSVPGRRLANRFRVLLQHSCGYSNKP
jgi:hypothetical protein